MRVLISGGCGFVGRHFVKALDNQTNDIVVVDNLIDGGGGLHPRMWVFAPSKRVKFCYQDIRDYLSGKNHKFDLVVHLAAVIGGRLTIENNPLAIAEDLQIDAAFWSWAIRNKPGHIISFSSSAAYPVSLQQADGRRLAETDVNFDKNLGMPDLTYGWAKLTNEYLGQVAAKKYDLKIATYRPFSGYGEDQSLAYPFPSICRRAVENKNEDVFEVWGSGNQSRDFVHIDDIVEGVLLTYPLVSDGSPLNLCSGQLTTFKELARLACTTVGYSPEIVGNSSMPEGVFSRVGDPTLVMSYGWIPKISIEEGVRRSIEFQLLDTSQ